jgi:hypothetical protein
MSNLAYILLIAITSFVVLMFVDWVKGEFPDNLAPIPDEIENIMRQYCADSPNGNMTADLVDTGKINSTYASWNCDYVEEKQKLGEKISKNLQDILE